MRTIHLSSLDPSTPKQRQQQYSVKTLFGQAILIPSCPSTAAVPLKHASHSRPQLRGYIHSSEDGIKTIPNGRQPSPAKRFITKTCVEVKRTRDKKKRKECPALPDPNRQHGLQRAPYQTGGAYPILSHPLPILILIPKASVRHAVTVQLFHRFPIVSNLIPGIRTH